MNQELLCDYIDTMSCLKKERTGLCVNIWIDEFGYERKFLYDSPLVLIQSNINDIFNLIPVSINDPKILTDDYLELNENCLKQIFNFIKTNKDLLLLVWNGKLDFIDLIYALQEKGHYTKNNKGVKNAERK